MKKSLSVACLSVLLGACGGGGSTASSAPQRPTPPPEIEAPSAGVLTPILESNNIALFGDTSAERGQSVGFSVVSQDSPISAITWQVLAPDGSIQAVAAPHTKTIGFDINASGTYQLSADIRLSNSQTRQIEYSFEAQTTSNDWVNLRLDHQVSERGKVSLRVDTSRDISNATYVWEQLSGPVSISPEIQDNRLFFEVPAVTQDSLIQYQVSVNFADGEVLSDTVLIGVSDIEINEDGYFFGNSMVVTTDMLVADSLLPYSGALRDCVYNNVIASTCSFGRLPLIGQQTNDPQVSDILSRTIVSHPWMAESFKDFLENSATGADMLKLLRAVTAVVISYDVRPSFYWAATGAIYLDARNFWRSPEQRDTLNEIPDFRSNFGSELNVIIPWRYVKNNQNYPNSRYPTEERQNRSFADLEADIAWLLYHELAHANDFFPSTAWGRLTNNDDPLSWFRSQGTNSDQLLRDYPLMSQVMKDLAQVSFAGLDPSAQQKAYTGDDLIPHFSIDIAPAYYAYLNEREDFATLFERFMMAYRLNAQADVALITRQNNPSFIVSWGQRNRFNDPSLQDRVVFTIESVLPSLDPELIQQSLPEPILMDPNKTWFENIQLNAAQQQINTNAQILEKHHSEELLRSMQGHHHGRPGIPKFKN